MSIRAQRLAVIRRKADGLFYEASQRFSTPRWTPNLEQANFVALSKVKSLIKIDWGRDPEEFDALEVAPALKEQEDAVAAPSETTP